MYINTKGKECFGEFAGVSSFSNGFACVKKDNGMWTFINTKGEECFGEFEYAGSFYDGYACIQKANGKYTFINTKGKECFGEFDAATRFENGFANVKKDWQMYINTQGKECLSEISKDEEKRHKFQRFYFPIISDTNWLKLGYLNQVYLLKSTIIETVKQVAYSMTYDLTKKGYSNDYISEQVNDYLNTAREAIELRKKYFREIQHKEQKNKEELQQISKKIKEFKF